MYIVQPVLLFMVIKKKENAESIWAEPSRVLISLDFMKQMNSISRFTYWAA